MTDSAVSPALHEITLVLGLMAVVAALVTLARRIELPYPTHPARAHPRS